MKVLVISLKRSCERRERMTKQLSEAGINFDFLDAIDASKPNFPLSERRNEILSRKRFGYRLTEAEIACFSSHYHAWEQCVKLNKATLILEDNCDISEHLFSNLNVLSELSNKYHFIKLAATGNKSFKTIERIDNTISIIRYRKRTCGIMGYVISPKAANKFITNAHRFIEPVDDFMEKPYKHGVSTYNLVPELVKRAQIPSTIGSSRKDKTGLRGIDKVYIELFRLYEQFRDLLVKHLY